MKTNYAPTIPIAATYLSLLLITSFAATASQLSDSTLVGILLGVVNEGCQNVCLNVDQCQ